MAKKKKYIPAKDRYVIIYINKKTHAISGYCPSIFGTKFVGTTELFALLSNGVKYKIKRNPPRFERGVLLSIIEAGESLNISSSPAFLNRLIRKGGIINYAKTLEIACR